MRKMKKRYRAKGYRAKVKGLLFTSVIAIIYCVSANTAVTGVCAISILFIKPLYRLGRKWYQKHRYLNSSLSAVDKMSGHDFENYLKAHFERLGYRCKNVGENGHDFGVDLIACRGAEKLAIQAKRYNGSVGIKAVQEAVSGMNYYDCNKAMVVTNSTFTQSAQMLAEKCNVELIDRTLCKKLFKMKIMKTLVWKQ